MRFIILLPLLLVSCNQYSGLDKGAYLYFEGLGNKEVLLSKVVYFRNKKTIIPIHRIFTNTKINLPQGRYLLSNDCSSYEFSQASDKPSRILLNHVQLNLLNQQLFQEYLTDPNQAVDSLCYNVLNEKEYTYKNRVQFDILPGPNSLFISGKKINFDIKETDMQNLSYTLVPLSLTSKAVNQEEAHFFIIPQQEEKKIVIAAPLNGKAWLFPGTYLVEVNGTKKPVTLGQQEENLISLGLLKVTAPESFPFALRSQLGGQPISAFIDDKVLIRLNEVYPVFPGKYKLNLEASELEKEVDVQAGEMSVVKTLGAQIDHASTCEILTNCFSSSKITLHENQEPFILMVIPVGLPFLVFDGNNHQYGVEGVKGIFKALPISSSSIGLDSLGLLHLKWEVRYTNTNTSTEFVRLESKSPNLYGKSVDLSFFKPTELYLPKGNYILSYFIGDQTSASVSKSKTDIDLTSVNVKEVSIPIFVRGSKQKDNSNYSNINAGVESSTLTPIKK